MSKLIINKHQLRYIPEYDLYLQRVGVDNATLILSSVIHEVYSYGDNQSVNEFWRQVFNENFRYIAIRDLTPRKSIDRMSDINDVSRVLHNANPTHLAEFQSIWGKY